MKGEIKKIVAVILALVLTCGNTLTSFAENQKVGVTEGYNMLSMNGMTTAAIVEDGSLYMWGDNSSGQIGNGTRINQKTPEKILSDVRYVETSKGNTYYTCAITEDDDLYMWGDNSFGQIGDGTMLDKVTPQKVLSNVENVKLSGDSTAAITKDGSLYVWGFQADRQKEDDDPECQRTPMKILSNIKQVEVSSTHTAAITEDGDLYMWGGNNSGQIGNGTTEYQRIPKKVLSNVRYVQLTNLNTVAIAENGDLYMWGDNYRRQIGNGTMLIQKTPQKILSNIEYVELIGDTTAAITENGDLYMWGYNNQGQVGNGTTVNQAVPEKILSNVKYVQIGSWNVAAITDDNDLYMWGYNHEGEIGNGTRNRQAIPQKILSDVEYIKLDSSNSSAITKDGSLYMWGINSYGQIGDGTKDRKTIPQKILSNVKCVEMDGWCVAAIVEDSSLYMWGSNFYGQIGNGTISNQLVPVKILDNIRLQNSEEAPKEEKNEYDMRAYSPNQDLVVGVGNKINILCALYCQDELVNQWDKPVFSVSNGEVMEVIECEKIDTGYELTLKAIREGSSTLTVTDGDSGAKVTVDIDVLLNEGTPYSYMLDEVPSFYPDVWGDRKTQTNVYDCNGLYVNNFPTEFMKVDDKYAIEFDVYNSLYMNGSVDVYNKYGEWIESYCIDKHTSVQGVWDTAKNAYFLVSDLTKLNTFSYTAKSFSKHTHVKISVPEGGYFTIGASYGKCPGTFLYNTIDYMLLVAKEVAGNAIGDGENQKIYEATLKEVLSNQAFANKFFNEFSDIALNVASEATKGGYGALAGALTAHAAEMFGDIDLDFWGIAARCYGISENIFIMMTPPFVGSTLKFMFGFSSLCDITGQTVQITNSINKPYISIYTPKATGNLTISGVTVCPDEGAVSDKAVAQVFRISNRDALVISDTGLVDVYEEYNISIVENNSKVQPNGNVTVKIPLPEDYVNDECIVLHQQEDNEWEVVDAEIEDGFIVFTVDHFSCFAVAKVPQAMGKCGEQAYWKFDQNGTLVIGGQGAMNDFSMANKAPWYEYRNQIKEIKFENGIESIGKNAFAFCAGIAQVEFPESITKIDDYAFESCNGLTKMVIPQSVTRFENGVFKSCSNLSEITFLGEAPTFAREAFLGCEFLIRYPKEGTWPKEIMQNYGGEKITWLPIGEKLEVCKIFTDVPHGAWYEGYVQYVYDNDYMTGSNSLFNPTKDITRAQLVTILYRMVGSPKVTDRSAIAIFSDIAEDSYYTNAVCWAYTEGIAAGNDGKFNPGGKLTRQQMAAFLYRFAEVMGYDTDKRGDYSNMLNADEVSAYAKEAVSWAVGEGFISGSAKTDKNGNLVYDLIPRGNTSRAQLASVMQRFCEQYGL